MADLQRGYEVDAFIAYTDNGGNPALVDGVPVWTIDSAEFTLVPAADGMSAVVQGTGTAIGTVATITVTADADLGEGVVNLPARDTVTLISGTAAATSFTFGTPRPIA